MRKKTEYNLIFTNTIEFGCTFHFPKHRHEKDDIWAEFDRIGCAFNMQWIPSSAEETGFYYFVVDELDKEYYEDAKKLMEKIHEFNRNRICTGIDFGYGYWATEAEIDWDYDEFKQAFPEINISDIKES